jgi:transcriptional regulator with XRE-family HTH domain
MATNEQEDYLRLVECLKTAVRARGWTYKAIAQKLKLSEPTIKRIFQGVPCNVDKLTRICGLLQVSFLDLMQLAGDRSPQKYLFTPDQENFFSNHLDYYAFFYALYYQTEGDLTSLQKAWEISEVESFKYLRQLEKLQLLELHPGNEVRFKIQGQLNVNNDGPVMKTEFIRNEFLNFARTIAERKEQKYHRFRVAGLQLSYENFTRFTGEMQTLLEKYYDKGARDEVFIPEKERTLFGLCVAMGPYTPKNIKHFWDYGRTLGAKR